ncbi:MAG: DNA mismatch repair protein [bacterium]|nr:DNA mismatch repair protein [bacterium]
MADNKGISIIFPNGSYDRCRTLSDTAIHDLGLDVICNGLSNKEKEQSLILGIMSKITDDPEVVQFRLDVFDDIYRNPAFREKMLGILDKIEFLKDFGSFRRDNEESSGTWDLLHRLEEIRDYIGYVEALQQCLSDSSLKSRGLKELKERIDGIYNDSSFEELKKDIANLKASTSNLKSVTLGVNLNERFEAKEIGLISVNSKAFSKSTILENFGSKIIRKDSINPGTDWDGSMRFQTFSTGEGGQSVMEGMARARMMIENPILTMAMVPDGDMGKDVTSHMDRITDHMLGKTMKAVKEVLGKYVGLSIMNITALIPEFLYYVRWAEFIKRQQDKGFVFCKATLIPGGKVRMKAKGFYNMRLSCAVDQIVDNDLDFDCEKNLYILTGANRGGKTTVTQAIGLLHVLAQGGIFVPAKEFSFTPVDCIFTHFPADEDKTLDFGRLGEECNRFRELFGQCTENSLLLLNETFSTTSFEEGFFIAKDAVRAILKKGTRCIYNTHMHKLAQDLDSLNEESAKEGATYRAASLVALSDGGQRSFKVKVAPPQGMSYAQDIARKYGVTYDMLVNKEE